MSCSRGAVTMFLFLFIFCSEGLLAEHLHCPCDEVVVDNGQDDVILPCQVQNLIDKTTMRWSFQGSYGDVTVAKVQSDGKSESLGNYKHRAFMQNSNINNSDLNISLILNHPKQNDTGRYQIKVTRYRSGARELNKAVDLVVNDAVVKSVTAKEGDPNVILPCNTTQENPDKDCIATWIKLESGTRGRCILKRDKDGNNDNCSGAHKDRVSIGDQVSLVLSSPTIADTGNYSCTIKRGECFRITSYVYLTVTKDSQSPGPKFPVPKSPGSKSPFTGDKKDTSLHIAVGIPSAFVLLVAVAVILGCVLHRRNRRRAGNDNRSGREELEMTEVPLTRPISHGYNNGDCGLA